MVRADLACGFDIIFQRMGNIGDAGNPNVPPEPLMECVYRRISAKSLSQSASAPIRRVTESSIMTRFSSHDTKNSPANCFRIASTFDVMAIGYQARISVPKIYEFALVFRHLF